MEKSNYVFVIKTWPEPTYPLVLKCAGTEAEGSGIQQQIGLTGEDFNGAERKSVWHDHLTFER